jgi:hypothetical protein
MDLSYPFRLYPLNSRNILTDYNSPHYVPEIIKLNNKLNNLNVKNTLVVLIIGSLIDDMVDYPFSEKQQYQHLPKFIHNHLLNTTNKIKIICVSPGNGKGALIYPQFINLTQEEYEWKQNNKHEYTSKKYPRLTYSFYNTLFPEFIDNDFVKIGNKNAYLYNNGITEYRIPKLYYKNTNFRDMYTVHHETETNIYIKIKKNLAIGQFSQLGNNLPSDTDKLFVNNFHNILCNLVKELRNNSGSLLILNYAVFRDNWMKESSFYFLKTLYDNFILGKWQNVKILNYIFNDNSSILYDIDNKKKYSYEDDTNELYISRHSRIKINNAEIQSKKKLRNTININNMSFKIINVDYDGNCMFNAILKQFDKIPISIKNARKRIIAQILTDDNIQVLLKEELYTRAEYDELIIIQGIDYVFDLHLYFMKEGPECINSENIREYYNLPLDVYYGGNYELSVLSKLLNVNIRIINIDNNIIEILSSHNIAYDDIYIKYYGGHYNIASLDKYYKFECDNINENMVDFSYVENDYNMKVNKFISSPVNLCL